MIVNEADEVVIMSTAPFEPDRFSDAVPYYLEYGFRYSDKLIRKIAAEAQLTAASRVLDLGCGPGFIANALAPYAGEIIGIDPNDKMLEAARNEASALGAKNVSYRVGSSLDLSIVDGQFQMVTMGQSFHWMDREATLNELNSIVAKNGVVALLHYEVPAAPENAWWDQFVRIRVQFSANDAFWKERRSKEWVPNVSILARSAFSDVMHLGIYGHRVWTIEDVVGHLLSQSATTPRQLGGLKDEFEATLRRDLAPFTTEGRLSSLVEHSAVIARRPAN